MKLKKIYFLVILIMYGQAWSNSECHHFYVNRSRPSGQTAVIGKMMGTPLEQIERAIFEFSELNLSQIKASLRATKGWENNLIEEQKSRVRGLMEIASYLQAGNFLLSPLHHAMFLKTIGLGFPDRLRGQTNYILGIGTITPKLLEPAREIIDGRLADSQIKREAISFKMADAFINYCRSYGPQYGSIVGLELWNTLGNKEKQEAAKSMVESLGLNIRNVKLNVKDLVPALDALFKIAEEKDGLEHLTKIFEYLLPENLKIADAQTRGMGSSMVKYGIPTTLGSLIPIGYFSMSMGVPITEWIGHYVANRDMMLVPLVAMGGFFGTALMSLPKITFDLPDFPGRVRSSFVRRRLQKDTIDVIQARGQKDIHLERDQLKAIDKESDLIAQLDIDFNAIKSDLHFNSLFSLIEISEWQNTFKDSITKLAERTALLEEKGRRLKYLTDESILTAQKSDLNVIDRAKNLGRMRELDEALSNQIAQLVQFQMDLLYLSAAYDRYNEKTIQALENQQLSPQHRAVIETKEKSLVAAKANISAMAAFVLSTLNSTISHMQIKQEAESYQASTPILNSLTPIPKEN